MEKDNLEMLLEDISGKFDLVLEGHSVLNKRIDDLDHKLDDRFDLMCFKMQALNGKIDGVGDGLGQKIDGVETSLSQRIDNLETSLSGKIDAVATDLAAHRRDTEAHPSLYKVKEGS
jgi:hypothetical protein